jgi:hypothetical protein
MYLLIALLLTSLVCCTGIEKPVKQERYFDNMGWFQAELKSKQKANPEIEKTLWVDGDSSRVNAHPESWQKELGIFMETDLNKAVYAGKFKVDTQVLADRSIMITCLAADPDINIRKYTVQKKNDEVIKVSAELLSRSPLLRTAMRWSYMPDSGYDLKGLHEMKGLRKNEFDVRARFRPQAQNAP